MTNPSMAKLQVSGIALYFVYKTYCIIERIGLVTLYEQLMDGKGL